jgi:alpha-amylase
MKFGKRLLVETLVGLSGLLCLSSCGKTGYDIVASDNAEGSVGYEIFVGSYKDSNGDYIGDINGVTSKLDYLHDLGIKRIWLMPIMPSLSYHKYNVDDYYSIDSKYGTLADFDNLVAKAKEKGIGVVIDMVLNHSSSSNLYFRKSEAAVAEGTGHYADWYVWSDTQKDGYNYSSTARAYYESRFDSTMPEFNLDNADVRTEIQKILGFWLDHGVEGFRLDATTYYYYEDVVKNVGFLTWLHDYVKSKKSDAYIVGECWKTTQSVIAQYAKSGCQFFNFPTSELNNDGPAAALTFGSAWRSYAYDLKDTQTQNLSASGESEPCFFVTNHDQTRWGSYFSNALAYQENTRRLCVNMSLLTPGTPWMYYGEELAMTGSKASNTDAAIRTGMIWGGDEQRCDGTRGFDDSSYQVKTNVADSLKDGYSLLNHYRSVIALRNKYNNVFEKGVYEPVESLTTSFVNTIKITYLDHVYYLVHNDYKGVSKVDIGAGLSILGDLPDGKVDSSLNGSTLEVQPFSSVLLG